LPRRVLVTGAASGLGRATATRFAAAGDLVLLTDVDGASAQLVATELADQLGADAPCKVAALALDVRDDAAWHAARRWIRREWGGLDILINNAGVAGGGRFEAVSIEDWEWILEINLLGVVRGCRTFVPDLKEQGSGQIVNVASLAGLLVPPVMSSYNVSKAGVVALSETLRSELAPAGVGVTCVCPGFFPTNLMASLRTPDPAIEGLVRKLMGSSPITADAVADLIHDAVVSDRPLVLTERTGRLAWWTKRLVPPLYRRRATDAATRLLSRVERGVPSGDEGGAAEAGRAEAAAQDDPVGAIISEGGR
jgi:NAD(P)-dependent dehydrogenase (short-subunit alcohol dehydrogenase family)